MSSTPPQSPKNIEKRELHDLNVRFENYVRNIEGLNLQNEDVIEEIRRIYERQKDYLIRSYEVKLSEVRASLQSEKEIRLTAEHQRGLVERQLEEEQIEHRKLRGIHDDLSRRFREMDKELHSMRSLLQVKEEELVKLREELKAKLAFITESADLKKRYELLSTSGLSRQKEAERAKAEADQLISQLEQDRHLLREQLNEFTKLEAKMKEQFADRLAAQMYELSQKYEKEMQQYVGGARDSFRVEITRTESVFASQLNTANEQIQELTKLLAAKDQALSEVNSRLVIFQAQVEDLKKDNAKLDARIRQSSETESMWLRRSDEWNQLKASLSEEKEKNKILTRKLEELQQERMRLITERNELEQRLNEFKAQVSELTIEVSARKQSEETLRRTITELEMRIKGLQDELDKVRRLLGNSPNLQFNFASIIAEYTQENESLKQEIFKYKVLLDRAEKKTEILTPSRKRKTWKDTKLGELEATIELEANRIVVTNTTNSTVQLSNYQISIDSDGVKSEFRFPVFSLGVNKSVFIWTGSQNTSKQNTQGNFFWKDLHALAAVARHMTLTIENTVSKRLCYTISSQDVEETPASPFLRK